MDAMQGILRWIHIVAGIMWIGLLYFFNFVNSAFAPTMDGDTKQKVVPELMPRALYWFRWGAAYTWITGVLLLLLVFYHGGIMFDAPGAWGVPAFVMIAVTFLGVFAYDLLVSSALKPLNVAFWAGWVLVAIVLVLLHYWALFSMRATAIHLGGLFGTTMAFNVWFRIWPAQQKIITAIKDGQAPDAALVAMAGARSKHNTYMSVPLLFTMMSQHATWAANPLILGGVVLFGFALTYHLYDRAKNVKGF